MARQIAAGLNFSASGIPYWTSDIGGYAEPDRDTRDPQYQELYTRWFEFGTFCPILRTHGWRSNDTNELFSYGPTAPILISYDRLRQRLLPYLYSLAWRVTHDDYTIMRPLFMDWRMDERVLDIGDQFMFGPALLVNPVVRRSATSRSVYLPQGPDWYDFWTCERSPGQQFVAAHAPLARVPIYVRSGAILPLGPSNEWAGQTDDPIELRIYPGQDGSFDLYEDAGDGYGYERGEYATIPIRWTDRSGTITIGSRRGSYPGISQTRRFRVTVTRPNTGCGIEPSSTVDAEMEYHGSEVSAHVSSAGSAD